MKNRLVVMVFTFLLMIAVTPLVFGKLMNSKFNKMLQDLQNQGIELKEIKDKSSYIQTDKIFEVKIPGKLLNNEEIKYIEAIVETKFKNLPVTTVDFNGSVKRVELVDFDNKKINDLIKGKIKFFVTTPNFKVYTYKIMDNTVKDGDFVFDFKGIKGVYYYPNRNAININLFKIQSNQKIFVVELKNISEMDEKKLNEYVNKVSLDLNGSVNKVRFFINKLSSKSITIKSVGKINNNSQVSFKNLHIANFLDVNKTDLNFKIKGLDAKVLSKFKKAKNQQEQENYLLELISKGFGIDFNLNISNISYLKRNLGFLKLIGYISYPPNNNIKENIDFNVVNFDIKINTTPTIAQLFVLLNPKIAMIMQNAKTNTNVVEIEIKKQNGEFFINGKKVKSH